MWLGRRPNGALLKRFDLCLYFLQTHLSATHERQLTKRGKIIDDLDVGNLLAVLDIQFPELLEPHQCTDVCQRTQILQPYRRQRGKCLDAIEAFQLRATQQSQAFEATSRCRQDVEDLTIHGDIQNVQFFQRQGQGLPEILQ